MDDDSLGASIAAWVVIFAVVAAATFVLGTLGCTTTRVEYIDPLRPEATVRVERQTFLRHGTVTVDFPINAQVRIEDRPISAQLAWLVAGLGCIGGGILGAAAGPVGAGLGCLGGGALGGIAGSSADEKNAPPEEAPPLKPIERQTLALPPGSSWSELNCGGKFQPAWCLR